MRYYIYNVVDVRWLIENESVYDLAECNTIDVANKITRTVENIIINKNYWMFNNK